MIAQLRVSRVEGYGSERRALTEGAQDASERSNDRNGLHLVKR